ncbi:MAG: FGGY-family carbohydrate kinase, partial [bacterium]|nr:FGGY-family carbohydrate kinase [bacterium]
MPDLFNFLFTGQKVCEFSNDTTTQFFNPRQQTWALDLLHRLNIPTDMLPEIVPPGTVLGPLRTSLAEEMGIKSVDVIAPACHDTGSAVAAVPMTDPQNSVYISCGTWALLGAEIKEPAITPKSLANNFTNEGGVCNTFRFLKNISGLWMVQECKRIWAQSGQNFSWAQLIQMASKSPALISLADPDHAAFLTPGDMPARIRTACEQSGQPVPETEGAVIRAALESLALKCRLVLGQLEDSLEQTTDRIHIVGGGIQNTLLCQFIANATDKTVLAGPIEATALGNILLQAMAKGQIGSLSEAREVVRNSTEIITYEPEDRDAWDEAFGRFQNL